MRPSELQTPGPGIQLAQILPANFSGPLIAPVFAPGSFGAYDADIGMFGTLTVTAIAGVPEPATWAMMLVGLGGLGSVLRSRRKLADECAKTNLTEPPGISRTLRRLA